MIFSSAENWEVSPNCAALTVTSVAVEATQPSPTGRDAVRFTVKLALALPALVMTAEPSGEERRLPLASVATSAAPRKV